LKFAPTGLIDGFYFSFTQGATVVLPWAVATVGPCGPENPFMLGGDSAVGSEALVWPAMLMYRAFELLHM